MGRPTGGKRRRLDGPDPASPPAPERPKHAATLVHLPAGLTLACWLSARTATARRSGRAASGRCGRTTGCGCTRTAEKALRGPMAQGVRVASVADMVERVSGALQVI